ncbi:hypothetical protein E2I00_016807, partial [Balaenoptera physalus]
MPCSSPNPEGQSAELGGGACQPLCPRGCEARVESTVQASRGPRWLSPQPCLQREKPSQAGAGSGLARWGPGTRLCFEPSLPWLLLTAGCSRPPSLEPWREAPVRPPGSGGSSGDGGWGPTSDQSSPSTPSPPLPPEAAHFLFGEPALRKRKSSLQGLFQCLWKRCGKVLSSASGMQRHI